MSNITIFFLLVMIYIASSLFCASYIPIEKIYEDNKIVKVILKDKTAITGWYIITYNTSNRITKIEKFIPQKNIPQARIQLHYKGKLLSNFTISSSFTQSNVALYQSTHMVNYTSANTIKWIDISFTKPASIKLAGTTKVRIQYLYTDGVLTGLQITGDAFSFKLSCTLAYHKSAITSITIDEKRYNPQSKIFEQGLRGHLSMEDLHPIMFYNEKEKKSIRTKSLLHQIYTTTYIKDALEKIQLTKGNEAIIDYFIGLDSSM